ncbi:DNA polymerase/3'-5' exonuclease PolX [Methylomusa anaerophila]|uniref:DNA polymerase beta n=1 Tax=Methylomusa anaerophila TaxID=1930071 RepID=A0A348AI81_9FIRM|nr:DNA polymerase/3'-5' exonuclease PolX [Methylomusa anaerophila]BBB90779.1 DNA polymerase/3'-5' exonuclease PolX [Methylomusa anaerophila]
MTDKYELAQIFKNIAVLLELKGENVFKARAYDTAARIVEQMETELTAATVDKALKGVKGIGPAISQKIHEYIDTGRIRYYEEIKAAVPPALFELVRIPGLGPKKAVILYDKLGINSIGELEYACRENRLVALSGFGLKTQAKILQGIKYMKKYQGKYILSDAWPVAELIAAYIRLQPGVEEAAIAGAVRRRVEIVDGIDIVVAVSASASLITALQEMPGVEKMETGETLDLTMASGIHCRIFPVPPEKYGYTLFYRTGSPEYLAKLPQAARPAGIGLTAAGLVRDNKVLETPDEKSVYTQMNIRYVEPELREKEYDMEADNGSLRPLLIDEQDIRGIFHVHTTYSDGSHSLADMAAAARKRGLSYLGVADHSQTAVYAHGLKIDKVYEQRQEIDALNSVQPDFLILAGMESDILPDGSLDYPDDILAQFDFVIASVHSAFRQSESVMTRRIIRAMENPFVTMLGHATGRILLARPGYEVNMKEILAAAKDTGTLMEINASPYRLDLDWRWHQIAKENGIRFAINPDAHAIDELEHMRYGIAAARKGGLTAADVINTRPISRILHILQQKRKK